MSWFKRTLSRRSHARRLNKATQHTERLERIDVRAWLLKPEQKATRLEVYTLLRQYDEARRWRETPVWQKALLALGLILSAPVRIPYRWIKERLQPEAEDEPQQEQEA